MPQIKILIACCSTLERAGACELFSKGKDFKIIKEADTMKEAILYSKKNTPDIFMFCFNLYREIRNSKFKEEIKQKDLKTKFVLINSRATLEQELELAKQGVFGIFKYNSPKKILITAIKKIHGGEPFYSKKLILSLGNLKLGAFIGTNSKNRKNQLTKRELSILEALSKGHTNPEIAANLYIAESTVKTHLNNIYKKLCIKNRVQASSYAFKNNLFTR